MLSGKGGVGKTTLVANLGVALSQFNQVPLLVDTNIKASSLGFHLGFYEDLPITLKEVSEGEAPVQHSVMMHPDHHIRFLPSPIEGTELELKNLDEYLKKLKQGYKLILVDIAPAFSEEAMRAIECLDQAIVVSNPRIPAITDAMRTIKVLRENDKEILGIVLNKIQQGHGSTPQEVEESCGIEVIGEIPWDGKVNRAVEAGKPVVSSYPNSKAAIAFKQLAAELLGIEWQPPTLLSRLKDFFGIERRQEKVKRSQKLRGIDFQKEEKPEEKIETQEDFRCDICGEVFDSKQGLKIHRGKKHKETEE